VVFGSFTAIPVALAARLLHIPFYLHEQTRTVGLANRLICRFAAGCAYSYPESISKLHCTNKLHTGNLVRPLLWHPSAKPPFSIPAHKPILFVTGGNQGSKALVDVCLLIAKELSKKYQIILQTGKIQAKSNLALIRPWFPAEQMAWLLHRSRIVICRGGANTIAEIMIAGTPAVIIPLPNSSGDEQSKNANLIHQNQAGVLLDQAKLNPESLLQAINTIESAYPAYKQAAKKLKQLQNPHAAESFYQFVICHP